MALFAKNQAQVIKKDRAVGSPGQCRAVVGSRLRPSTLEPTEVSHVGVGIDVDGVEGQGASVTTLCLLRSLCKYNGMECEIA